MKKQGLIIAVEGIDGAGKAVMATLIAAYLRSMGEEVVQSAEPTPGVWADTISSLETRQSFKEEIDLFLPRRKQHYKELIKPATKIGAHVVLDRYIYSCMAYQGTRQYERETDNLNTIERIQKWHTQAAIREADVLIVLDVKVRPALRNIKRNKYNLTVFENEKSLAAARWAFKKICDRHPNSILIDVRKSLEEQFTLAKDLLDVAIDGRRSAHTPKIGSSYKSLLSFVEEYYINITPTC